MGAHISIPLYQRAIPQRYRLEAGRCRGCGHINFPPKGVCAACRKSAEFEPVSLNGRGRVHTFTRVSAMGAPPEFLQYVERRGPYWVGIVELEEGPRVVAQLVVPDDRQPYIGQPVRMVLRRLYEEDGVIRYGYKFETLDHHAGDGTEG